MDKISNFFIIFGILLMLSGFVIKLLDVVENHKYRPRFNSSDSFIQSKKSGMTILIDYDTDLQYLSTPNGGLTPRLGLDGKQLRYNYGA